MKSFSTRKVNLKIDFNFVFKTIDVTYLKGVNSEGDKIGFLGLFLADFLLGLSGLYIALLS